MPDCTSTRGEWGQPCPACGERLPERQAPMESWQSARARRRGEEAHGVGFAWVAAHPDARPRMQRDPSAYRGAALTVSTRVGRPD